MELVESFEPLDLDLGYDPGELDFWEEETVELSVEPACNIYQRIRWDGVRKIDTDSLWVTLTFDDPLDFAHQASQVFITVCFTTLTRDRMMGRSVCHRLTTWLLLARDSALDYRIGDRSIELPLRAALDRRAAQINGFRVQTDFGTRCRAEVRFRADSSTELDGILGPMVRSFNQTDFRLAHSVMINLDRSHRQLLIAIGGSSRSAMSIGGRYRRPVDHDPLDPPPTLESIQFTNHTETLEYRVDELDLITLRDLTIYRLTFGSDFYDFYDWFNTIWYTPVKFTLLWSFDPPPELRGYLTVISIRDRKRSG